MRPAQVIEIVTPKKVLLNGLLFGPVKPRRVIIWIHGLNSSMFSKQSIMELLVDKQTSVIAFNNRGHDKVSYINTTTKKDKSRRGGGAHEAFTESVDDIEGAIRFARKCGAKEIFLAGHSTGCQKSIYWASKKGKNVKGIILLAPVSDYAAGVLSVGKKALLRAEKVARRMVKEGKTHELLPSSVFPWSELADAQRFLSLYTPDSIEEIFTYAQSNRVPSTFKRATIPTLVLLAEKDEYADRPAKKIGEWFMQWLYTGHVVIIPKVKHSFKGGEKEVATAIRDFVNTL